MSVRCRRGQRAHRPPCTPPTRSASTGNRAPSSLLEQGLSQFLSGTWGEFKGFLLRLLFLNNHLKIDIPTGKFGGGNAFPSRAPPSLSHKPQPLSARWAWRALCWWELVTPVCAVNFKVSCVLGCDVSPRSHLTSQSSKMLKDTFFPQIQFI